jgi:hypothetical protein
VPDLEVKTIKIQINMKKEQNLQTAETQALNKPVVSNCDFRIKEFRGEFEIQKKMLYQEAYELQNFIKQWLKIKRYLPYEEEKSFFPSRAWPSHIKE